MKSTTNKPLACDALWNERQAHMAMQQSKERVIKDGIRARNRQALLDEQLRKERVNSEFFHRVWVVCNIVFAAIVIYALFHFA